ncbi:MAG: TetR family transcriptional regulator [Sphingobium sp.]|uniref:TetR/AcrR family transcriptional regulator n=1 Tax=Sphingobium sp. TaxID=1912891 RepID=UPI000DB619DF|nr:TetR/AcrR family transcriptional regulator [Sphingobium sp.]PZU05823.1 MAG: TetR family transcriptional regulator [Sphingobium sp.]
MNAETPRHLIPRKTPRQARSEVTRDAILEAAVHILLDGGMQRLTTKRVADRAGVSVGSLYQYFQNKRALVYAVNGHYLDCVAVAVEAACDRHQGASLEQMVDGLVDAYSCAKLENPEITRALYRSVAELDIQSQVDAFSKRVDTASRSMLESAPGASFDDIELINTTLLSAIFGTIRNAFDRGLGPEDAAAVHRQLSKMCLAYLKSVMRQQNGAGA